MTSQYEGYYWEYPGFPSLFVPYGATNDFFFSGHVGCCILIFLEFGKMKWHKLKWLCLVNAACQILLMLITRGHYSIDMLSGAVFAHYSTIIVQSFYEKEGKSDKNEE